MATPTPPPARLWWCAPGGNRLHVAIQALAPETARLRAELACYRALEACGAERVHGTLVGRDYELGVTPTAAQRERNYGRSSGWHPGGHSSEPVFLLDLSDATSRKFGYRVAWQAAVRSGRLALVLPGESTSARNCR